MAAGRAVELRRLLDSTDLDDVRTFLEWRIESAERDASLDELHRLRDLGISEGAERLPGAEAATSSARDADEAILSRIRASLEQRGASTAASGAAPADVPDAGPMTSPAEAPSSAQAMDGTHESSGASPPSPETMSKMQRQISADGERESSRHKPEAAGLDPSGWAEAPPPPNGFWGPAATAVQSRLVPRAAAGSPLAEALLTARLPVVITGSGLAGPAVLKWDLAYLAKQLGEVRCTVFRSATRSFRYWDGSKAYGQQFEPDTSRLEMTAREFALLQDAVDEIGADSCGAAEEGAHGGPRAASPRFYLQTGLVEGVGEFMLRDFRAFDWAWLRTVRERLGWADLTSNLLLVGERGNVTPAHYDEQQNLFAQLSGSKRVVLFSPDDFCALCPFPVHHPNDRQSMIDFDRPDESRFPRFGEAAPLEATLQPGEVLYIPQYWWHHVENLSHGSVSLNFWFRDQEPSASLPLSPTQRMAMRRNVEKICFAEVQDTAAKQSSEGDQHKSVEQSSEGVQDKAAKQSSEGEAADAPARLRTLMQHILRPDAPPQVAAVRKELTVLLSHVMPKEQVAGWLAELIDGRFVAAGTAALASSPSDAPG